MVVSGARGARCFYRAVVERNRILKTNKVITATFGPSCGPTHRSVTLPAGLRVRRITEGGTRGKFWIDEFPKDLFPPNSFELHDAVHYGIVIEPEDVE